VLVQFLLLTAARRSEAAQMRWSELDGAGVWTLPAARNKVKVDLIRPLSAAARDVLARLPRIVGGEFVFSLDGRHAIGGLAWRKELFNKACGVDDWVTHDLRRTARSLMSRAGVPSDYAEHALGHIPPGIRRVYDRHQYFDEKRRAFEALAAQIERIVNPTDNVTVLPARG
jgi:integrase